MYMYGVIKHRDGLIAYTLDDNPTKTMADENDRSKGSHFVIFPVVKQPDQEIIGMIPYAALASCPIQ
jgi:hypothetical protein